MNKKNKNSIPKIHHLIRYFILLGAVVFFGYMNHWQDLVFLILIGPALYLAQGFKNVLMGFIEIASSPAINFYGFLLPFSLVYFSFLGFLIKQLFNERGPVRFLSLFALIGFLIFIHYFAWSHLNGFLLPPEEIVSPA